MKDSLYDTRKPDYPYRMSESTGFIVKEDDMPYFRKSTRCTLNFFLICCVSGEAEVLRDTQPYHLQQNSEFILFPDTFFRIVTASADFQVRYCCASPFFFDEVSFQIPTALFDYISLSALYDNSPEEVQILLHYLALLQDVYRDVTNIHRHEIAVMLLRSYLLKVHGKCRHLLDNVEKRNSSQDKIINQFWNLLTHHYREHRDVAWYANELCISTRYLSNIFAKKQNGSPKQLINDYVTLAIKIELQSSTLTIQQIADALNFSDQSSMGRFFKMQTSFSPRQYRERIKGESF